MVLVRTSRYQGFVTRFSGSNFRFFPIFVLVWFHLSIFLALNPVEPIESLCIFYHWNYHWEPLKLCGNSLEKIQGSKFKFENPWNKCRCCHWKKFKAGNSRVKIASYLVYQRPKLNLYLSTMKIKGNSGVIWPLKKFKG